MPRAASRGQASSADIAARRELERWEATLREWAVLALTAAATVTAAAVALFA